MITAKIIKDSINSKTDDRLTTFVLIYPRFVHAEFMTHRMLSKNSASTRAIPTKKIIQSILDDPAMPEFWGKNRAGMQAYEQIEEIEQCKLEWLDARDEIILRVEELVDTFGLHKQIAGRLLEPWFNITVLVSGTEWENFFALRAHKDAQPEIRVLAELMLEEYNKSIPEINEPISNPAGFYSWIETKDNWITERAEHENWHIPFEEKMPENLTKEQQLKVAIARCARLSYLTFDGEMNVEKDFEIYDKLLNNNPKHASPAEHVAFPIPDSKFVGNFKGWVQFRKLLPNESSNESRMIKRRVLNGVVI
jgi:thymidylate synthase ThyX